MKLQIVEESQLAFFQNDLHVDIRAGLSSFGAFAKGSAAVPNTIRIRYDRHNRHGRRCAGLVGALQRWRSV